MTVTGISCIKNEVDVVRTTIEHMLTQVDQVLVMDNGSTDGTYEILREIASQDNRLTVRRNESEAYHQDLYMTDLAQRAMRSGASWVVPFDADEIWYIPDGRLGNLLVNIPSNVGIVSAKLYNHYRTDEDLDDPDPMKSMVWRESKPGALPKVVCRCRPSLKIDHGNHSASYEFLTHVEPYPIEIRHFPYRSGEQMVKKSVQGAAGLNNAELDESIGAHWRGYANMVEVAGPEALHNWFKQHFYFENPSENGMVFDPAPIGGN